MVIFPICQTCVSAVEGEQGETTDKSRLVAIYPTVRQLAKLDLNTIICG